MTVSTGFAGLEGDVYGVTTPSVSGVAVIGETREDVAINVYFEATEDQAWFAPELVELLHFNEGTTFQLDGSPDLHVRLPDGSWSTRRHGGSGRKAWWKFWP